MRIALTTSILLLIASTTFASDGPSRHANLGKDRLALQGRDPVSYFGTPRPSKGSEQITAEHDGAVYRFTSQANRDQFLAEPQKYVPQYGGWCATAMAEGKKVEVDPRNYRVTEGRLFLFYKSIVHDAQDDWKKDEANLAKRADAAWTRLVDGK
jgi:YHS domain-containing protein